MKILILVQDYPSLARVYAMSYVHSRALQYQARGNEVVVLNFSARDDYEYEGVQVRREEAVDWSEFDCIASHAPNIRNHVRFLKGIAGANLVFFFHGHEVLKRSDYPKPYKWNSGSRAAKFGIALYDVVKLIIIKVWLRRLSRRNKVGLVFVSDWMKKQFERGLRVNALDLGRVAVIPNAAHTAFIDSSYCVPPEPLADFVTIRPLDESKYCMDLVLEFARKNPERTFHVYGRGRFFDHNPPPPNLTWFDEFLPQAAIPAVLNNYRCALMPTRYDAQGVMMCEMATYGIPLITTNFSVCAEMLADMNNCRLLEFDGFPIEIQEIPRPSENKNYRFSPHSVIEQELSFL